MVTDWIPANRGLVDDVTGSLEDLETIDVTSTIDRPRFLRGQGVEPRPGIDDVRTETIRVIPRASAAKAAAAMHSGDLVFWVGGVEGIFVLHTGLFVRSSEGVAMFRHASSKAERVLDEPFLDYAAGSTYVGFLVLRLRDEPAIGLGGGTPRHRSHERG